MQVHFEKIKIAILTLIKTDRGAEIGSKFSKISLLTIFMPKFLMSKIHRNG